MILMRYFNGIFKIKNNTKIKIIQNNLLYALLEVATVHSRMNFNYDTKSSVPIIKWSLTVWILHSS